MRRLIERIRNLPNPLKALATALHGLPDPDPRGDRAMMFLGHYSVVVIAAYAVCDIWDDLAGQPGGWPNALLSNWGKGGDEEVSPEVPDPALSK
jgi:hypothetical protein